MKLSRLTICSLFMSSIIFMSPAFAASELRKDWQGAKKDFDDAFKEAYKEQVSDKKLNKSSKKKLGMDKGNARKDYLKYGAKLGPNLDKLKKEYDDYQEELEDYYDLGWEGLTKKDSKTALELAELNLSEVAYELWLEIKDLKSGSMNSGDIQNVIRDAKGATELNISGTDKDIWRVCGNPSNCTTSEEGLQKSLKRVQEITSQMLEGNWRDSRKQLGNTKIFEATKKKVNDAADKVKDACGDYQGRINKAETQIKVKEILTALREFENSKETICKNAENMRIKKLF